MPPKIKSNKLLNNVYENITSLIKDLQIGKPAIKQELKQKAGVKSKLPDVIAKDPYFVPTTLYNREGPYGEEIVYGTRKATPWQLAMGEDINHRLNGLGYSINDFVEISRNGETIIDQPAQLISKQAQKPIDIVDIPNPKKIIDGYKTLDRTVLKLQPTKSKNTLSSIQLHESLMHGTDDLIADIEHNEMTKPRITDAYKAISYKVPYDPNVPAHKWQELRATLGEVRADTYKFLAAMKDGDFYEKAKITPELREEFNQMIDDMELGDLKAHLSRTNAYGKKYAELLRGDKTKKSSDFVLDQLKMLLKYYPAVGLGTASIYNPEPDNYVEERKYKNGGQIYKKDLNKFTAAKKRF